MVVRLVASRPRLTRVHSPGCARLPRRATRARLAAARAGAPQLPRGPAAAAVEAPTAASLGERTLA
eukprot:7084653-Pyramimonas_sp.AAC.1